MKRFALLTIVVALLISATHGDGPTFTVSGFGGYPLSQNLTSMWLIGPDGHPLVMVYFHGPDGWFKTSWKIGSKFAKGEPGWAEFKSDKITQHLKVDGSTGDVEVQSEKFNLKESNTFLVLHAGEGSVAQTVIALGLFDLPKSQERPASVLLLESNPGLMERIASLTGKNAQAPSASR